MRPTAVEAEWAMRAVVFDRVGDGVGGLSIEATPARRGDPPNIRRVRVAGPWEAMTELERGLEPIVSGASPPLGIIARMSLAVSAAVARAYGVAERSGSPEHVAKVRAGIARRKAL